MPAHGCTSTCDGAARLTRRACPVSEVRVRWQGPGGCGLGADLGDGRFWHTGQNTGSSCFSFARPASGAPVAVMTDAEDCRDTLVALIEMAQRHHG